NAPLLHHDLDRLSERSAAHRLRLRGHDHRRDRALQAARWLRRVLPHRHGRARIKMLQSATKAGVTPKQWADKNVERFQAMTKLLNASNDQFIRTTEPRHHRSSQAIWEAMQKN